MSWYPFGQHFEFNPKTVDALMRKYWNSLGFDEPKAAVAFEKYVDGRKKSIKDFDGVVVGDKTVGEYFSGEIDANLAAIRDDVSAALSLTPETVRKRADMTAIKQVMANSKEQPFDPEALLLEIREIQATLTDTLTEQQARDKARLEAKLNDADFKVRFLAGIGKPDDEAAYEQFKSGTQKALEESHTAEKEAFEKDIASVKEDLHKAAQTRRDRITFLAGQYEHNMAFKTAIDEEVKRRQAAQNEGARVTLASERDAEGELHLKAIFEGLDPEAVYQQGLLTTMTGRKLTYDADKKTFSLDMYNRWNPWSWSKNAKMSDLKSLAMAVRAQGAETIEMNVKPTDDEEYNQELARQAYMAAREVGYEADEIKITIGGKEQKIEDLFKDHPGDLTSSNLKADHYKGQRESKKLSAPHAQEHIKRLIAENRPSDEVPSPDASPTPPTPPTP